jgi:hypothetical protein
VSRDNVNRESKAKIDIINWESLIADAKQQIEEAKLRIAKLTDTIEFFKLQMVDKQNPPTQN